MNWCGTLDHNQGWKWLTLSMHCSGFASQLYDLQYERFDAKAGKTPRRTEAEEDGQMRLFPLDTKQRGEFTKFAKNLRFFTVENRNTPKKHDAAYWKEYGELEFNGPEMYDFFAHFPDDELNAFADQMDKIGSGEPLDDYKPLIDFLYKMSSHADWKHDEHRGGCF